MNTKTARLLRKYGRKAGGNYGELKRRWNARPRPLRASTRRLMTAFLGAK